MGGKNEAGQMVNFVLSILLVSCEMYCFVCIAIQSVMKISKKRMLYL